MKFLIWTDFGLTLVATIAMAVLTFNNVHKGRKWLMALFAAALAAETIALGFFPQYFGLSLSPILFDVGLKVTLALLSCAQVAVIARKISEAKGLGAKLHLMPPSQCSFESSRAIAKHVSENGRGVLPRSA